MPTGDYAVATDGRFAAPRARLVSYAATNLANHFIGVTIEAQISSRKPTSHSPGRQSRPRYRLATAGDVVVS
jgi:hypothetical protein